MIAPLGTPFALNNVSPLAGSQDAFYLLDLLPDGSSPYLIESLSLGPTSISVTEQLAQRARRHEALGDQPMAHQIGDRLGVLHVGLASRHVADMPSVADDQIEVSLQDGIDRAPAGSDGGFSVAAAILRRSSAWAGLDLYLPALACQERCRKPDD